MSRLPAAVGSLWAAGVQVDASDGQGNTPLWQAVFTYRGDGSLLSLLVRAGDDPARVNLHGVSPRRLADWRIGQMPRYMPGTDLARSAIYAGQAALAGWES